jgi:YHS domain-containing protein
MIVLLALVLPRVFLRGDVENARAGLRAVHDGQRFSFCSDHCQARFTAAPHRYTTAPARGNTVAADADSTAVTTVQGDS